MAGFDPAVGVLHQFALILSKTPMSTHKYHISRTTFGKLTFEGLSCQKEYKL